MPTRPEVRLAQPLPEVFPVGAGQYQLVSGEVLGALGSLVELELDIDVAPGCTLEVFPGENEHRFEFLVTILWRARDIGSSPVLSLRLTSPEGESSAHELGSVELTADSGVEVPPATGMGDQPLVAICMATYNPDIGRLTRQIESILCQSYGNWMLIISDDASDQLKAGEIAALSQLDPGRIRLYRHQQNIGFYHNFERALGYVPKNARLVAFSDQDDIWYPEKLQVLVEALSLDPGTTLAYSDMRIVDASGEVIADSYWQNRRNEYRDLGTVLIANTVTGAASLFKRDLLKDALPFPVKIGDAYHDHWLACVAMCRGELAYVAEPLYDYMQYSDSVLGHCDFESNSLVSRIGEALRSESEQVETTEANKWQAAYRHDCLRLQLMAKTLQARIAGSRSRSALRLLKGGTGSILRLLRAYLAGRVKNRTTNSAELWLAMGFLRGKGHKKRC